MIPPKREQEVEMGYDTTFKILKGALKVVKSLIISLATTNIMGEHISKG